MAETYNAGYAFIVEGDTEKEFYLSLLNFLCRKHSAKMDRIVNEATPDVIYVITFSDRQLLVKFHAVNAITQVPRAGKWFTSQCAGKHTKKLPWYVFLCYDTDKYTDDVSKFHEGDWEVLELDLKKATVLHIAAAADIEDVLLLDLEGVCNFISCEVPEKLVGRKGKVKLRNIYRDHQKAYHEGKRARPLIDSLNMQLIIDTATIPLQQIEQFMFE